MVIATALGRTLGGFSVDAWNSAIGGTDAIFLGFFAIFALLTGAPGYGYMLWAARKHGTPSRVVSVFLSAPELVVIIPVLVYSLASTLAFGLDAIKLGLYVVWLVPPAIVTTIVVLSVRRWHRTASSSSMTKH